MKNKFVISFVIVFTLVIAYVIWQYQKIMKYSFCIRYIHFDAFSLTAIKGNLFLNFTNNSDIAYTYYDCDIDMYINNVKVSKLISVEDVEVAPHSITPMSLAFDVKPNQIFSIKNIFGLQNILDKNKVLIGFYGNVYVKAFFLKIKIPININKPLSEYSEKEKE